MSQPPVPGPPPPPSGPPLPVPGLPPPPLSYGGYGGDLQHYRPHQDPPSASHLPAYAPPTLVHPPGAAALPSPATPPWVPGALTSPSRAPVPGPPQRPTVVGLAATLAVTASLQFVAAVTLLWLLAVTGDQTLGTSGADGVMFHILNRFDDRMVDGLAWPLYLFPAATIVLGLLLPTRRRWVRQAFSGLAVAAVAWLAWLFRSDLRWLVVPGVYIAFCAAITWTGAASRWYGWSAGSDAHPQAG